jgi:uncharacterized membrane protein
MKWHKDWKRIIKSYSFAGLLGNLLIAISLTLGTVTGILSSQISLPMLISLVMIVSTTGLVGRFIDQTEQDIEREEALKCQNSK